MTEEPVEAREWIVRGRVQGVGFRWWTKTVADELGIAGSVRNLPDRSVRVRAAGPRSSLDRMQVILQQGPRLARVDSVNLAHGGEPGTRGEGWAETARGFVIERSGV